MFKGNFGPSKSSGKPSFNRGSKFSRPGSTSASPARSGGSRPAGASFAKRGSNASASRFSSPSRGGSRFGGGSHFGGGSRSGGNKGMGQYINPARFVCKAEPVAETIPYVPQNAFVDFMIDDRIKANVAKKGYINPTPIQDQSIPHILKGADVVGIANTGTGKTAAFLLPLLNKVLNAPTENVLIIVPTRELAQQINEEFVQFRGALRLFSACCVGGASISQQISTLRRNHNFVIGTPGRLKDLIERGMINPARFATIVLDEADRMLDMGFVNDMRFIMNKMPKERQTLFFSATTNNEIFKMIKEFLREPITVSVKTGETTKNVDQDVIRVAGETAKINVLHDLLIKPEFSKVLVFGRTKHGVEKLAKELSIRGFTSESIHGNKNQSKRQKALSAFKDNRAKVLVATDVAARGLDIPNVSHVINFDIPATYEDYVHRIGRTGRGGSQGTALTFIG
jgi:superfamily II DNA/RNA helicase